MKYLLNKFKIKQIFMGGSRECNKFDLFAVFKGHGKELLLSK